MSETYSGIFSCSNYEQRSSYKDLFTAGKNEPPPPNPTSPPPPQGLHGPKITKA